MSLLDRSGQRWKITLFIVCLALGAGVTLLQGFLYGPLGRELTLQLVVGGMFLVVFAFTWACLQITCPRCRLRLVPHALRSYGFFTWFARLLELERCPQCGSRDGQAPPAAPRRGRR